MLEQVRQRLLAIPTTPPDALAGFELREGLDSTDDPALWVYVIVRDEKIEALWPDWSQLRQRIRDAVSEIAGEQVNCYIRMWAESEQTAGPVVAP